MNMKPKLKSILIFIAVFIAIILVYVFVFQRPSSEDATLVPVSGSVSSRTGAQSSLAVPSLGEVPGDLVNKEFLNLLLNIRGIHLDAEDVFSNPIFGSLMDFTITLIQDSTEGRLNPFAPIGSDFQVPSSAFQDSSDEDFTL